MGAVGQSLGIGPGLWLQRVVPNSFCGFGVLFLRQRKGTASPRGRSPDGISLYLELLEFVRHTGQPGTCREQCPSKIVASLHDRPATRTQGLLIETE